MKGHRFLRVAAAALLALPVAAEPFPRATPESQGVSSEAVLKLIDRLEAEGDMVHSYMLVRHGKVVAEGWKGFVSYTLQGAAFGLGTGNFKPARFWEPGHGAGFQTVDLNK